MSAYKRHATHALLQWQACNSRGIDMQRQGHHVRHISPHKLIGTDRVVR